MEIETSVVVTLCETVTKNQKVLVRAMEDMGARMGSMEARMDAGFLRVDERFDQMARDVDKRFDQMARDVAGEVRELHERFDETNGRIDETNARMDARFDEMNAKFDETNGRIDETNARMDAGFDETNARIDETNGRIDETNARMDARFDETNARIDEVCETVETRFEETKDLIREGRNAWLEAARIEQRLGAAEPSGRPASEAV